MDVTQTESTVVGSGARSRPTATATVLVGAVCGLAWAAAFRGWMAELAGGASRLEWYGTFVTLDQPRGAWVATLGVACVLVLCLASSIPFRRVVPVGDPAPTIRGPG